MRTAKFAYARRTPTNVATATEDSPANVATAAEDSPAAVAEAKEDPNPVICKTVPVTGSRLKSNKVCRTKSDWDGDATNTKGFLKSADQGSGTKPRGPTAIGR